MMIKTGFNPALAHEAMVREMTEYVVNSKLNAVVLGISGGIDSTVVANILKDVANEVRKTNPSFRFVGLSMPTETTDKDEFRISELVGNAFCDIFKVLDITDEANYITIPNLGSMYSAYDSFRIGNVKSRLRMIHLYDFAKAFGGIVVGTDNYTELTLGYSTIGGDGLFDYCPIQNLWKTEIYHLAEYYMNLAIANEAWDVVHALSESISIPPQAGLGITSTDMDEIGAPDYYAVDEVLYNDENGVEQSDEPYVQTVLNRKRANAYKKNLPIVIERDKLLTI